MYVASKDRVHLAIARSATGRFCQQPADQERQVTPRRTGADECEWSAGRAQWTRQHSLESTAGDSVSYHSHERELLARRLCRLFRCDDADSAHHADLQKQDADDALHQSIHRGCEPVDALRHLQLKQLSLEPLPLREPAAPSRSRSVAQTLLVADPSRAGCVELHDRDNHLQRIHLHSQYIPFFLSSFLPLISHFTFITFSFFTATIFLFISLFF